MRLTKEKGKKVLTGIGILLLLGVSAGCSEVEKFSWDQLKATHYRMVTGKSGADSKMAKKPGQPVVPAIGQEKIAEDAGETMGQNPKPGKVDIVLYFADQNGDYLVPEKRKITMVPGLAKATIEELIRGPKQMGLSKTIPEGTLVKDINLVNGLCIVDFNKQFRDNHWGGSSGEILTIYSVVDTLTQFPTIKKVEFLVEGQKIDTLAGHMDLSIPVAINSQLIKDSN